MVSLKFPIIAEKDSDGYFAFCPNIQGCYTQGDTYEEVLENIKDVIKLLLEEMNEAGTKLPETQNISFTTVEVAIWRKSFQELQYRIIQERVSIQKYWERY